MTEKKIRPQDKWNAAHGLISVSYKLTKSIADDFSKTCEKVGVSKKAQLEKMMTEFIEQNKSDNLSQTIKNEDMISKKEVLNRLERTRPSQGEDNSKERYRHLQWIADRNTILEI